MSDVQFLDPGPYQPPPLAPGEAAAQRPTPLRLLSALAWAGAAALAILTPLQGLYTIQIGTGDERRTLDGWGRYSDESLSNVHGARYGIVFTVGGVLFAICALLLLVPAAIAARRIRATADGPNGPSRIGAALGLTALALIIGVGASAALDVESVTDNLSATQTFTPGGVTLHVGILLVLTLATIACALLALVLTGLLLRPRRTPPAMQAEPMQPPTAMQPPTSMQPPTAMQQPPPGAYPAPQSDDWPTSH